MSDWKPKIYKFGSTPKFGQTLTEEKERPTTPTIRAIPINKVDSSSDPLSADYYLNNKNLSQAQEDSAYNSAKQTSSIPNPFNKGISDIAQASKEGRFASPQIHADQNGVVKSREADPITKGTVSTLSEPVNKLYEAGGNLAQGLKETQLVPTIRGNIPVPNYGKLTEGGVDAITGALHGTMLPFTVPFGAVSEGLRQTGKVGSEVASGIDQTMNLPFEAVGIAQKGTQKALEAIGIKPAEIEKSLGVSPELSEKVANLATEIAGLYLMKKAHDVARKEVNKVPTIKIEQSKQKLVDKNKFIQGLNDLTETSPTEKPIDINKLPKKDNPPIIPAENAIKKDNIGELSPYEQRREMLRKRLAEEEAQKVEPSGISEQLPKSIFTPEETQRIIDTATKSPEVESRSLARALGKTVDETTIAEINKIRESVQKVPEVAKTEQKPLGPEQNTEIAKTDENQIEPTEKVEKQAETTGPVQTVDNNRNAAFNLFQSNKDVNDVSKALNISRASAIKYKGEFEKTKTEQPIAETVTKRPEAQTETQKGLESSGNQPKVLYHGTNANFDKFDIEKSGSVQKGDWGKGIYLESSKSGADYYRQEAVKKNNKEYNDAYQKVLDIQEKIKKEKDWKVIGELQKEEYQAIKDFQAVGRKLNDTKEGKVVETELSPDAKIFRYNTQDGITNSYLAEEAKARGYDVLLIDEGRYTEEYVVLNPDVIKIKAHPPTEEKASQPQTEKQVKPSDQSQIVAKNATEPTATKETANLQKEPEVQTQRKEEGLRNDYKKGEYFDSYMVNGRRELVPSENIMGQSPSPEFDFVLRKKFKIIEDPTTSEYKVVRPTILDENDNVKILGTLQMGTSHLFENSGRVKLTSQRVEPTVEAPTLKEREPRGKEPYEMTIPELEKQNNLLLEGGDINKLQENIKRNTAQLQSKQGELGVKLSKDSRTSIQHFIDQDKKRIEILESHKNEVAQAIAEGKIKSHPDYPELTEKATNEKRRKITPDTNVDKIEEIGNKLYEESQKKTEQSLADKRKLEDGYTFTLDQYIEGQKNTWNIKDKTQTLANLPIWEKAHRNKVNQALKEGKQVPENVIAEYPDLAEKYKQEKIVATKPTKIEPTSQRYNVEEKFELLGGDGKYHNPSGFPYGVKAVKPFVKKSTGFYLVDKEGKAFGAGYKTKDEAIKAQEPPKETLTLRGIKELPQELKTKLVENDKLLTQLFQQRETQNSKMSRPVEKIQASAKAKKIVKELNGAGLRVTYDNRNVFINGKKIVAVDIAPKVKVEDVTILNDKAAESFEKLSPAEVEKQTALANIVEPKDLDNGLGQKTIDKGLEQIKKDGGEELKPEALAVRDAALQKEKLGVQIGDTVVKGEELVNQAKESLKETPELQRAKAKLQELEDDVFSTPEEIKKVQDEITRLEEVKPKPPKEESLFEGTKDNAPVFRTDEGIKAGKGAEDTPLFTQPKIDKAQVDAFKESAAKKDVAEKDIQDFGEKIGGARKDYWSELDKAKTYDVEKHPLSKTFPLPDYAKLIESGVDKRAVGLVRAMREEIPTKPTKSWKMAGYKQAVELFRDVSEQLLSGKSDINRALELLGSHKDLKPISDLVELYSRVGHDKSLKGVRVEHQHWSMYKGEKNVDFWAVTGERAKTVFSNMRSELGRGKTREEAIDNFVKNYDKIESLAPKEKESQYSIYRYKADPNTHVLGKKVGSNYIDLKKFATSEESVKFRTENKAELDALLEKSKFVANERNEINRERTGTNYREGKDVAPEDFTNAFQFRGIEFGNWVNKSGERQTAINNAYDALKDLSLATNVPENAISLNGSLGIGFGSRGTGGIHPAAAHYESLKATINLTREHGAGSLAHEWWHALDNYFSKARGDQHDFITDRPYKLKNEGVRQEVLDAYKNIVNSLKKETDIYKRSSNLDERRSKPYWSTPVEITARAFENYITGKLNEKGISNDYLSNMKSKTDFISDMADAFINGKNVKAENLYPYLTEAELTKVKPAFDKFFETLKVEQVEKPAPNRARYVSEESYQQALKNTEKNIGKLYAGFDPSLVKDFAVIGAYHLENIVRSGIDKAEHFAEYSKKMIEDFGEKVKPYLKDVWEQMKQDRPELQKVFKEAKEKTTGIKNATVNAEREQMELSPIEKEASRGREQVWEEAKTKIASGEVSPRDFVSSLKDRPRSLSDLEDSYIAHDRISLTNERELVSDQLLKAVKDGDEQLQLETRLRIERVNKDIAENDLVADRTGTETARGLAFRRWLYKNDYSLASIEKQLNVARQGKPLSEEARKQLESLVKEHEQRSKVFEEKLKLADEKISRLEAEKIIKGVQRQISFENRRAKRQRSSLELVTERKNLYADLYKITGNLNANPFVSPEAIKVIGQIAKNYLETGINSAEGIVDAIYNDVKDKVEGITPRDIRDAITGYGRQKEGKTINELNANLRDIKNQLTLISKIEDAQSGKRPFKARFEKKQPNETLQELRNELNAIIKDRGLKEELSDTKKLEAYKKRIVAQRLQIEDRIKSGKYEREIKEPLQLDQEAIDAKAQLLQTQKKLKRLIDIEKFHNRTGAEKAKDWFTEIINLPRSAFMTVADFSAPLRQGLVLGARRPIISATKVLPEAMKAMFIPKTYDAIEAKIALSPNKKYYDRYGLEITEAHGEPFNLGKREEIFMSTLAEKIPVWGEVVKASERGFTAYMNLLRTSSFDEIIKAFDKNGYDINNPVNNKLYSDLAKFVNTASLRGSLGKLDKMAPMLNGVIFSPRNLVSRLQLLNPVYYAKMEKPARVEALKSMASMVGAGLTVLSLAKLAGADVEGDPRSTDFGKIKLGNTRVDIWGGFQQFARYFAVMITNETKSTTGKVRKLDAKKYPFTTRADVTQKFLENKFSPQASLLWSALKGKNNVGEDFDISDEVAQRMIPLAINDSYQAIDELGWLKGGALTVPAVFGAGMQTYKPKTPKAKSGYTPWKR